MSAEHRTNPRRPLRVGLDMRLTAYRGGGIARYAEQLATALKTLDGVDLMPYYSARDKRAVTAGRLRTPPHHRLEEWALPLDVLINRTRLDIFHSPDFISPRLLNAIRIATVHDLAFQTWPGFLPPNALAYYNRLERSRNWTDGWIAPSRWTADALQLAHDIPTERIQVIPHGVSLQLAGDPPLSRAEREDFILAVGTVEPRKNYDLLLDALEAMNKPPRLVIAGAEGWQSDATETRLREAHGVGWFETADDATLKRLYRTATAVVVPSYAEGFGFAALEAMACGTPVISSGAGALPEVTGEVALVPESLTAEAWAAEIDRIREDHELWRALSSSGVERARQFTWDEAGRQTAAFYRRLLQARDR